MPPSSAENFLMENKDNKKQNYLFKTLCTFAQFFVFLLFLFVLEICAGNSLSDCLDTPYFRNLSSLMIFIE